MQTSLRIVVARTVLTVAIAGAAGGGCSLFFSEADRDAGDRDAGDRDAADCVPTTFDNTIGLVDDFLVDNPDLWEEENSGPVESVRIVGGALQIALASGNGDGAYAGGGLNSKSSAFNLDAGRRVFVEVLDVVDAPAASVSILIETSLGNDYRIRKIGEDLRFEKTIAGSRVAIGTVGFNSDERRFWQLRIAGQQLIAEAGPTLQSLDEIGSESPTTAPGITGFRVRLLAEATTVIATPAIARFGSINTVCVP